MGRTTLRRRERAPRSPFHARGRSRFVLSGLLECGMCGGGFYAINGRGSFGCSWHKDRGPEVCASGLLVSREALEERVIAGLRELLTPDRVKRVIQAALEELRAVASPDPTAPLRVRLARVEGELENIVELAATHGGSEAVQRKLAQLERDKAALRAEIAAAAPEAPAPDWKGSSATRSGSWATRAISSRPRGPTRHARRLRPSSATSDSSCTPMACGASESRVL
jgi:hypothetical protein